MKEKSTTSLFRNLELKIAREYVSFMYVSRGQLTPWKNVVPGRLTHDRLVKKFPFFCGTRNFIPLFKKANRWSTVSPRQIQLIFLNFTCVRHDCTMGYVADWRF
jgi:hypothetical protein